MSLLYIYSFIWLGIVLIIFLFNQYVVITLPCHGDRRDNPNSMPVICLFIICPFLCVLGSEVMTEVKWVIFDITGLTQGMIFVFR